MNNIKIFILMAGLMALFGIVGQAMGGQRGMLLALLLQTITASVSGAVANLARFGLFTSGGSSRGRSPLALLAVIFAPIAAMIIQFAISRQREFKADATGAEISGKPLALASALQKLQQAAQRIPMRVSPTVAPLAQVNPLSALGGFTKLFSTHPSTEERVARLHAMAGHPLH